MKNYIHTFCNRNFSLKFFNKNVFNDTKKFVNDIIKKKYNTVKINENKNNFIIVDFNEKKTLSELKYEINKLILDYKKTNLVNIQFEILQTPENIQIASLVTNFNISELEFLNNNSEDSDNSVNIKNEELENEKINSIISKFLIVFKNYIKKHVLTEYSDLKIDEMILSYSYQYNFKKLIITIPLTVYNDIVFEYLIKNKFDIKKISNNDKNNKLINADPLIVLNYDNITCYFQEFMNVCNVCKNYHKIFNKNVSDNDLIKICMDICSKCSFAEVKNINKKSEHKCISKEENICYICKFYYKENYNHLYKDKNCNHTKNQLKNFISSNRINSILSFNKNNIKTKPNKSFILKKDEYPNLNEKKIIENNIKEEKIIENNIKEEIKEEIKENIKENIKEEIKEEIKDNIKEEIKEDENNSSEYKKINTIKKINNIHNYEMNIIDEENIKINDIVNIKIFINGKSYIFKKQIE